jgi:hypothetical protein
MMVLVYTDDNNDEDRDGFKDNNVDGNDDNYE